MLPYIWSCRTRLNKYSFYILQQQILHTSRNARAIRNAYLWFYLFYFPSVFKWRNYILLTVNKMKILVRLYEFNVSIFYLWHMYIFTHVRISKAIWWSIVNWKSYEGVSNYSVCNTAENSGSFLQKRLSLFFSHRKQNPWNKGRLMHEIAIGQCPRRSGSPACSRSWTRGREWHCSKRVKS